MKKSFPLAIVGLLAGLSSLSMLREPSWDLLSEEDAQIQKQDLSRGPALSAILDGKTPYWESFNEWQCFPTDAVQFACSETEHGGTLKVPVMHFIYGSQYYEFSMDPEPRLDCDKILEHWKYLITNESAFCTYAAHLQEIDDEVPYSVAPEANEGSAWIISQLKTRNGRWTSEDTVNWIQKEDDDDEEPTIDDL